MTDWTKLTPKQARDEIYRMYNEAQNEGNLAASSPMMAQNLLNMARSKAQGRVTMNPQTPQVK